MELTPDEKKRIEEEESKRLAEEQYRAQVRTRLSEHSTQPTSLESVEPTRNRTGWPKGRLLLLSCLALGALWFAASHYIVFAKNGAAILRKENFQLFPLTLDVSHWTISDVMHNPDTVLLFVQQRKAYLLPGGPIIQAVTDTVSAGGSPALSLAKQFRETFGEHGQVLIGDLVQKRADSFAGRSSGGLKARTYLNEGIRAYKNANYPEAVASFQKAVERDPTFKTTHLYLATAYMSQYTPGAESPENVRMAADAMNEFQKVLELDPKDELATASIASLYFNQKKLEQAKEWNQKLIAINPQNKDAYYTLGVIAWTQWLGPQREARNLVGLRPQDPGPIPLDSLRQDLKAKYLPMLDEGIRNMKKALELDGEYDEAMAYMNLPIRYRADLVDSPEEYRHEIEIADTWIQKARATKDMKSKRKP